MSLFFGVIGAIGAALIAAIIYSYQRAQDRKFAVMDERRKLYTEYVRTISPSLYKHVQTRSPEHHSRLETLNSIGAALQIIAPTSVCEAHIDFLNHLRSQTQKADPATGEHLAFFDEEAGVLLDRVLAEMRKDALPAELNTKRPA